MKNLQEESVGSMTPAGSLFKSGDHVASNRDCRRMGYSVVCVKVRDVETSDMGPGQGNVRGPKRGRFGHHVSGRTRGPFFPTCRNTVKNMRNYNQCDPCTVLFRNAKPSDNPTTPLLLSDREIYKHVTTFLHDLCERALLLATRAMLR